MASRSLDDLDPDVAERARKVQQICDAAGIDLLIYCTLRRLDEQARLYRQSRSRKTIEAKSAALRLSGFPELAQILDGVGPQSGPHVTNAAPGESFHNFGLAFDAVPLSGGKCCWTYGSNRALWEGYGEAVRQAGLDWAGGWTRFREYPHAQLGAAGDPLRHFARDEVLTRLGDHDLLPA